MTPLVGRRAELEEIRAALGQAGNAAGRKPAGSIIFIVADAGMGKTRLGAEARRLHQASGHGQALVGRAVPEEASLPYAALADTLRGARRTAPAVWAAAVTRGGVLGAIAPELAAAAQVAEQPVDQPVLFEALLDAVTEAAGDAATLWVLDDLHWADDDTWAFVRYAARRVANIPLVLAVTYRDHEIGPWHDRWPGLLRLRREACAVYVPLPPLAAADSEQLVTSVLGRPQAANLQPTQVTEIIRRGAGNPLMLEELADLAALTGGMPSVPDVAQATVIERTAGLGPTERELLDMAAVAGFDVEDRLLSALVPDADPALLVRAGLVTRGDDQAGFSCGPDEPASGAVTAEGRAGQGHVVCRFRHPLIREAVRGSIAPARQRDMHEAIASVMTAIGGYPPERVAAHLEAAYRPEAALTALESAAQAADLSGHVGRTATLWLGALHLAQRHNSLTGRRADLLLTTVWRLFAAGRWTDLGPVLDVAWPCREDMSLADRAQVAAVWCQHLFWTGRINQALSAATAELANLARRDALDVVGPLLVQVALLAWYQGDGQAAMAYLERAREIARRIGDAEVGIWSARADVLIGYGRRGDPQDSVARLRENGDAARAAGLTVPTGSTWFVLTQLTAGLHGLDEGQVSAQTDSWSWLAAMYDATFALLEGRHEQSAAIFRKLHHEYRLGIPTIAAWVDAREALLHLHRGDLAGARALLAGPGSMTEAASCGLIGAEWSAARGWLAWEEGLFEKARTHLARATSDAMVGTYNTVNPGIPFLPLLTDAQVRLGRAEEAAAALAAMRGFPLGRSRFTDAALAAAEFRRSPTTENAEAAATAARAAPWPWLHGLVDCWRAELLRDVEAAELARRRFRVIGAPLGVRRAEAALRALGVALPGLAREDGPLSPREMEVANLIGQGLTNPAIAARLQLSRPTVASHVAHILTKLEFTSRTQVAAWIAKRETQVR